MSDIYRLCVGCRKLYKRSLLIQLKFSGTKLIINPKVYFYGRSAYLCYNIDCVEKTFRHGKTEKTLKSKFKFTDSIVKRLLVLAKSNNDCFPSEEGST